MEVMKRELNVPSSDGVHTLRGVVLMPAGEARGFLQVVHGMTEHIARYERWMRDMAERGWICFGHDHLGHGRTADSDEELGYIAPRGGWELLVRDVGAVCKAVFAEYGKTDGMPYCLMGHSMGSFVVRLAAAREVRPDRLIVMGTGGPNPAAGMGLFLASLIQKCKGERHISPFLDKLAFGSYNKRFGGGSPSDPKPWLTNDDAVRARYYADKYCTFSFTVSAMRDLIRLIKESNRKACYRAYAKDMQVLLVSGDEDPVGSYGRGVCRVCDSLQAQSIATECILYDNARHEILNDFTYADVLHDLASFCESGRVEID